MIDKTDNHKLSLYNTLLFLSRNIFFYKNIGLKDTFETRIYLMLIHFSIFLIIYKFKNTKFPQDLYDGLFHSIENNLRELGYGDVGVNKKMKEINKILYDILLKINSQTKDFKLNRKLISKYFNEFDNLNDEKYKVFDDYLEKFYYFCFELSPENMIKDALNFKGI